jgi:hypothetical protein
VVTIKGSGFPREYCRNHKNWCYCKFQVENTNPSYLTILDPATATCESTPKFGELGPLAITFDNGQDFLDLGLQFSFYNSSDIYVESVNPAVLYTDTSQQIGRAHV